MALTSLLGLAQIPDDRLWPQNIFSYQDVPITIDATNEKAASIVQVPVTDTLTGALVNVQAVAAAQSLDVRAEGMTGSDPSGTLLVANCSGAIATPVAGTLYDVTFTAGASVTMGDVIAIVTQFTSTIGNVAIQRGRSNLTNFPYTDAYVGAPAWARSTTPPLVGLKFTTAGYYPCGAWIYSNARPIVNTYSSSSTPDEVGMRFQLPVPATMAGISWMGDCANGATVKLYLDSDTSLLSSVTMSVAASTGADSVVTRCLFSTPVDLAANTWYKVTVLPTTTSNVTLVYTDMASAAQLGCLPLGVNAYWCQRTDAGAWTNTATWRPFISLLLSHFDNAASTGRPELRGANL